jgi:hypothetical protein
LVLENLSGGLSYARGDLLIGFLASLRRELLVCVDARFWKSLRRETKDCGIPYVNLPLEILPVLSGKSRLFNKSPSLRPRLIIEWLKEPEGIVAIEYD